MRNNQKSFYYSAGALGLMWFFALVFAGCEKKAPANFERPPAPVTVAAAITRDVPVYLDAIGKTVAREVVSIQPQVSGRIVQ
ncbi:MAG: efflux RND transporter periplasmic adaptor subunit, partial [Deltaproteobacteria bacterium]|nr:efflux RND transporter periplasmic adaptor subunit [Deltaproteobacteria bacterium]